MVCVRTENWGRLFYDRRLDEFVAEVKAGVEQIVIDRPISAGCLVTGRCNLKCGFCYGNDEALPRQELSHEEWAEVFRTLREWGLLRVDLSGGEPTIRKDIGQIADAACRVGLNVVLSTNGIPRSHVGPNDIPRGVRIHVSLDSGFALVHEKSRLLRNMRPSDLTFAKTGNFIRKCLDLGFRVRVLTCIGRHNQECLFQLGEYLSILGVEEWNISRILRAGRAQEEYALRWGADDRIIVEQVQAMREEYHWMRIRFSNRTEQNGYFLLVLPDGTLATQYSDGRDKVVLGRVSEFTLDALSNDARFDLRAHGEKWLATVTNEGVDDSLFQELSLLN